MAQKFRVGLALSGGGFRAAAFHLGTFKCLKKLKLLDKIEVISAISGGSIIAAYYGLHGQDFNLFCSKFEESLKNNIVKKIIFTRRILLPILFFILSVVLAVYISIKYVNQIGESLSIILILLIIAFIFLYKVFPLTSYKEKIYEEVFFKGKYLSNMCNSPIIAINSTNLDTGTLLTFSKERIDDSTYRYVDGKKRDIIFKAEEFPISKAVASSTCFPVIFNPVGIEKKYFLKDDDYKKIKPILVDGGIYDNQGIHKITQSSSAYNCDIVICSDGSSPFKKNFFGYNPISVLNRVTVILMRRIKTLQFIRNIYDDKGLDVKEIAYLSLDWNYSSSITGFINSIKSKRIRPNVLSAHGIPEYLLNNIDEVRLQELEDFIKTKIRFSEIVKNGITENEILSLKNIKTGLSPIDENTVKLLSRHAEVLTEIQTRLYCPSLFNE